ncbi:non-hydrolyzing UDP-N-acetylglucosamine 2-epimerase [Adhaeribacter pallidiroseus]|uniref:UDP-N-acetylglucosamine 2-epimerase (Non-hydrolyzing) n=1 Tax=Adhaeribacter pallidiroseus TaxID=2072847 RepID=A0A369QJC5_9BACT|nr:UDP-N-acetylglucosamine 2-epimerase (non-hydrolyzing) [Adhaeribacter pallidiroseus]RDC62969.1 UDP-N-acetylglucosamine 2-epimerase (non-hydrolyzing) [Adhaeribacter pallidiroseus]
MKTILSIVGARPQFIKHAPVQLQLQQYFNAYTIHTGQHYDANMSQVFINELNIPAPDFMFDIGGSKPQGEQTGIIMTKIEEVCTKVKPDAIVIYGDTNSTLAGALIAVKMHIPLVHIEAGLRSYNRKMPEEVNRIVADEFADLLFCPTQLAVDNIRKEKPDRKGVFLCGDVMCDALQLIIDKTTLLFDLPYYFVTLHRPYNTDDQSRMNRILHTLNKLDKKVIFPVHPRTISRLKTYAILPENFPNIHFVDPVGYLESISYQKFAACVLTDSGGIQKEAYMLKKKCITLRSETEWSETLQNGWNTLVFEDIESIPEVINNPCGTYIPNVYGEGTAAEYIAETIFKNI